MKTTIAIIALLLIGAGVYFMVSNRVDENQTVELQDRQEQQVNEYQPTQAQGKINIDEVCEGALIRMTFPDGEAAAQFVKECKAGEHPEVIEQFKADMNLGAGAEI